MNTVIDLNVILLAVAGVCLLAGAAGIGSRHDRAAFAFTLVGVAALVVVVVK